MVSRKRGHQEISSDAPAEPTNLLKQIRNTWQFACLMQYIQFFGSALRIDNELDIDVLEEECLKPNSERLAQLALTMLKWVSSHRGLTTDIFDEYTRRQYLAKAPQHNPFGEEEEALKFTEMDIFTKLKVLHQLSVWTLNNPDRIRERMEESTDKEQSTWRVEPFGDDKDGRHYFLLDDNRLYRMTDSPAAKPSPKKLKAKAKPKKTGGRSSKRQKVIDDDVSEEEEEQADDTVDHVDGDDGLGGAKWECLAVTLDEYRDVIERFRRSKSADEKDMAEVLEEQAMPELLKAEESKARKEQRRQKELESLSKMATAKRSSRLADKQEKQKQEDEVKTAELRRQQELEMAHREHKRQMKQEEDRESRMMTREQRIRDREMRRILHEEDLSKLEGRSQSVDSSEAARMSERNRVKELEKKQRDLAKLKEEESEDWDFDCEVCGVHGKNIDDGTHSIACDRCGVWQHSSCHDITPQQAERDNFKFVCSHCKKPKTNIKLKLGQSSPPGVLVKPTGESASADVKPVAKVPQTGPSASPPLGLFKPTPPGAARPPSGHGYNHPQQPLARPSQPAAYAGSPPNPNGYPNTQRGPSQPAQDLYRAPWATKQGGSGYPPPSPSKQSLPSYHNLYQQPQPPVSGYQPQSRRLSSSSSGVSSPYQQSYSNQVPQHPQPPKPMQTPIANGVAPKSQSTFTSPANHAPTPSLAATQGNTSLRFSPTAQPPSSSGRLSAAANLAHSPGAVHAYSPNSNVPQQGGVSPVKHASPPHSSFGSNPASSFGQSPLPPQSPGKISLPPSQQQTPGQRAPSSSMGMNLDGAPTLSPSVNTNGASNAVPVKKMTPVKSPAMGDVGMTNGAAEPRPTPDGQTPHHQ